MSTERPNLTFGDAVPVTQRAGVDSCVAFGGGDCIAKSPKDTSSGRLKKRRKSRATNKAPLRVFPADVSNFMAMVHRLTGISSHSSHVLDPMLLPPVQSVPTVGPSSAALLSRWSHDYVSTAQGVCNLNTLNASSQQQSGMANLAAAYNLHQPNNNAGSMHASLPSLWEAVDVSQRTHDGNYLNEKEPSPIKEKLSYVPKSETDILRSGELSRNENLFSGSSPIDRWFYGTAELASKKEY